jgi:hypothetical protein
MRTEKHELLTNPRLATPSAWNSIPGCKNRKPRYETQAARNEGRRTSTGAQTEIERDRDRGAVLRRNGSTKAEENDHGPKHSTTDQQNSRSDRRRWLTGEDLTGRTQDPTQNSEQRATRNLQGIQQEHFRSRSNTSQAQNKVQIRFFFIKI